MASETDDTSFPDVIQLNVGGVHYTTYLKTLTKDAEGLLGRMFTGKVPVSKDGDGRYFIDSDGPLFSYVLDFLRGRTPEFPSDGTLRRRLKKEVEFLEIPRLSALISDESSTLHSEESDGSQENNQPKSLGQILLEQLKIDSQSSETSPQSSLDEQQSIPFRSHMPSEEDIISKGQQNNTRSRCISLLTVMYVRSFDKRDPCVQMIRYVTGEFATCREVFGGLIIPEQSFGKYHNKWFIPSSVESAFEACSSAGFRVIATISHTSSAGSYHLYHLAKTS